MNYTQGIQIDNLYFDVPLVSIKRSAEFLDKYAERSLDGDLKRGIIGVYFNYQMSFGIIDNPTLYESLWNKLTEPVEFHDFAVPTVTGTYRFRGYVSSVSDEISKIFSNSAEFQGLQCKFTAKQPARKPK